MACGCGSKKAGSAQFVYTSPKGVQTVYNTEVQAQAAVIRNGGGTVTPR